MKEETIKKIKKMKSEDFSYAINETGEYRESWRIFRIMAEFVEGYQFLSQFDKAVTVFGSARIEPTSPTYQIAEKLGFLLGKSGYATITGGGPGIMEAANKGAHDAGGESVGLNIQLPFEQRINPYVKKSAAFYYFFTRKVMLTSPANAFVFFPGGFGTMDEFFEVVDMMDLGKMAKAPVVLIGRDYWQPLLDFLIEKSVGFGYFPATYLDDWHLVDTAEEAHQIIETNAPKSSLCDLSPMNFHCQKNIDWKIFNMMAELVEGFEFLTGLVEDVTILGTKGIKPESVYYQAAYELGRALAETNYAVVTGGAYGVAEAANKGAIEMGGQSLGIGMNVGGRLRMNSYVTKSISFKFPFVRKMIVTAPSKAFVVFPGGLGTMHQLFEVLTLIQTGKMQRIPVILYDHNFWQPLQSFIKKIFVHEIETISDEDDEIYQIVDNIESIIQIIQESRKL